MTFDLAVIGLGLIGSGAVRHAVSSAPSSTGSSSTGSSGGASGGVSVVGIGPAEPVDWRAHRGPFASHYDSGRITRRIDARREWAVLASRSISQYPLIEQRSGIDFHRSTGVAFVRNDQHGIDNVTSVAARLEIPISVGPVATQCQDLDYLDLPEDWTMIREGAPAGAIDPRHMIEAQHRVAVAEGATVLRDVVVSVSPAADGFELSTASGASHHATAVLVAAGAYSHRFLDQPPSVVVRPEAIVLGEVGAATAQRLSTMPSLLYLLDHDEFDDVYVLPPVRYPDGRYYLKMGGSRSTAGVLDDDEAMAEWMTPGNADRFLPVMRQVLSAILPRVEFTGWRTRPCLITDTESGLPYIDQVDDGLYVAFGGNGHAAKSADAIGALGAGLALGGGRWTDAELAADEFRVRFGRYRPPDGSRHGN